MGNASPQIFCAKFYMYIYALIIFYLEGPPCPFEGENKKNTLKKHKIFYNSLKSNAIELKLCVYAHTMYTNDWYFLI